MILLQNLMLPFSSPFFPLFLLLILANLKTGKNQSIAAIVYTLIFCPAYLLAMQSETAGLWLSRMTNPFITSISLFIIPSIYLYNSRIYRYFLIIPAIIPLYTIYLIIQTYTSGQTSSFVWFAVTPSWIIATMCSVLILLERIVKLSTLRKISRIMTLLILLYGGFAFRQSISDYEQMLTRRVDAKPNIMNIKETTPVLREDNRLSYLPSAPCRFSADGGYVQGCIMELTQRLLQIPFPKVIEKDPSYTAILAIALGALTTTLILLYLGARFWCGWVCPLATIGDVFDFLRKKAGLPHLKPTQPLKLSYFWTGLTVASFGSVLAGAYAYIDENGKFMGCKIPVYPFCKLCPAQQVCPVFSQGPSAYPALPGWEWMAGTFRIGCLIMLGVFLFGFMTTRRLWCRFCPMGMAGGIFNRGGMLALKKNPRKCNGCGVCNEVCPMHIHFIQEEMILEDVSNFDCIYCLECIDKCPQDQCLSLDFAGKTITESGWKEKDL